jgi:hypothetical protein
LATQSLSRAASLSPITGRDSTVEPERSSRAFTMAEGVGFAPPGVAHARPTVRGFALLLMQMAVEESLMANYRRPKSPATDTDVCKL